VAWLADEDADYFTLDHLQVFQSVIKGSDLLLTLIGSKLEIFTLKNLKLPFSVQAMDSTQVIDVELRSSKETRRVMKIPARINFGR